MKVYVVYKVKDENIAADSAAVDVEIIKVCTKLVAGLDAAYNEAMNDLNEWKSKFRKDEIEKGIFDGVEIKAMCSDGSYDGYAIRCKTMIEDDDGCVDDWTYSCYKVVEKEVSE